MIMIRKYLTPIALMLLMISSCTPSKTVWEPKPIHPWLNGTEDCQPPCWNGLIPGETTFDQALEIVQGFEFINDEGLLNVGDDKSFINWYRGDRSNVYLKFNENKVLNIKLLIFIGDLGSVVNNFGAPDGYKVHFDEGGYGLGVYYSNYGLVFHAVDCARFFL